MAIKFIIFSMVIALVAAASVPTTTTSAKAKDLDNIAEGSDFYGEHPIVVPDSIPSLPDTGFDLTMENATALKNDLIYLLESFFGLIKAIFNKLQLIFYSNYTIFKSVAAVVFSKISFLYDLFVRVGGFLQNVFGIASKTFTGWSVQFPVVPPLETAPHPVYGVPTFR